MENILLTFLSDVKVRDNKVLKTEYEKVELPNKNVNGEPAETTNESAVRYLLQYDLKDAQISKIFIFASNAVRDKITGYNNEKDNTMTHLDYFKKRMEKFMPNVDECITDETIYPYDEDSDGEKNLRSVAEMAERIQKYARGKDICLHADLTGGMRHINMMMLDVIRLLEYSGVKIGKLIYSNFKNQIVDGKSTKKKEIKVEELNNIYDLFQLISGVEEFVNFGSVEALNKYYDANADQFKKTDALQKLIDAMENFAKSIKLCRYGDFKKAIKKLHDAINDFKADPQNIHDIFMARLIDKIHEKYDLLISTRGEDDLKIIRWCINHGYLQQALTLYTERIPEILGTNGFLILSEENLKNLDHMVENDRRTRYFYLLNVFNAQNHTVIGEGIYHTAIIKAVNLKTFDYDSWYRENLKPLEKYNLSCSDAQLLRDQLNLLHELKKNPKPLLNLDDAKLNPIRKILNELSDKLSTIQRGFERIKVILKFINDFNSEKSKEYFPTLKFAVNIYEKYPYAGKVYEIIYDKFFEPAIPLENFLSIMNKYYLLKDERNNSNHAKQNAEFNTADELEKFMYEALDEIEEAETKIVR